MILSHSRKFIFVKPRKVAGTSVELVLSRLCDGQDVITPFGYEPDPDIRKKHGARCPQNYRFRNKKLIDYSLRDLGKLVLRGHLAGEKFREHDEATKIRRLIGKKLWYDYTKISIVRNPWDHAVSAYTWRKYRGFSGTFEDYLHSNYHSVWNIVSSQYGSLEMDFIIRFEQLQSDLEKIYSTLGWNTAFKLPRAKAGIRKDKGYRKFYNTDTQEMVRAKNELLLYKFPYEFDGNLSGLTI